MIHILKKISVLCLSLIMFIACKDNNVPDIDKTSVVQGRILGGWGIHSTKAYVNVKASSKPYLAPYNLEDKLQEKLDDKASGIAFYFEKEIVYFFREGVLRDSSRYVLDEYKIQLDNPELIGFYAPYFYIKFSDDGLFVTYLRKEETFELLEKDGYVDMGLIRAAVEDAQCELHFQRN